MPRPKVIQELSSYLAGLFRKGLRSGEKGEGLFPVYWGHPGDFDENPELSSASPIVGLCLVEVIPENRIRASRTLLYGDRFPSNSPLETKLRRVPFWLTCRYVLSVQSDDPLEEQELIAAAIQVLLDNPLVPLEVFQSLAMEIELKGVADSFPISIQDRSEIKDVVSLRRHRQLIYFDVTVPLPSSRRQVVGRISERNFRLDSIDELSDSSQEEI